MPGILYLVMVIYEIPHFRFFKVNCVLQIKGVTANFDAYLSLIIMCTRQLVL